MRHVFGGLLLACCLLLGSSVGSRTYSGPYHANGVLGIGGSALRPEMCP